MAERRLPDRYVKADEMIRRFKEHGGHPPCWSCGEPASHRHWDMSGWCYFCPKHAWYDDDEPLD